MRTMLPAGLRIWRSQRAVHRQVCVTPEGALLVEYRRFERYTCRFSDLETASVAVLRDGVNWVHEPTATPTQKRRERREAKADR